MNLDALLPDPAYRIAASRVIDTPPAVVWRELVTLPMSALPGGFLLTLLRHGPDVLVGNERRVSGRDTFLAATPIPVLVCHEPRQLVSAGISQAWKVIGGNRAPVLDAAEFRAWATPGWIKVTMSFDLVEVPGRRGTLLSTETRIGVLDAGTARRFAPYWWMIRAGSVLIRREVLAAVKRRAEQ